LFPLVQLPKKFKVQNAKPKPIIRLLKFPLVQLPKKFKADPGYKAPQHINAFPLVQLPKKFKALKVITCLGGISSFH